MQFFSDSVLIIFINIYIYTHTNFIHLKSPAQWCPIAYLNIAIKYTLVATFYIASCYNRYHTSNISAYIDRISSQFEHEDSPSFIFTLPLCVIQVLSIFLSHYLGHKCYGIPEAWIWEQKFWKILFKAHFYIYPSISVPLQIWVRTAFLMKVGWLRILGMASQSHSMKPLKAGAGLSMFCASNQVFLEANVEASSAGPTE